MSSADPSYSVDGLAVGVFRKCAGAMPEHVEPVRSVAKIKSSIRRRVEYNEGPGPTGFRGSETGSVIPILNRRRRILPTVWTQSGLVRRISHTMNWGRSSFGRAPRSQCGGRGFDPLRLHSTTPPPTRPRPGDSLRSQAGCGRNRHRPSRKVFRILSPCRSSSWLATGESEYNPAPGHAG